MANDESHLSSESASEVDASWLVQEMIRAAEESPSRTADEQSVAEAIDQCSDLLSRFWPAEVGASSNGTQVNGRQLPSFPLSLAAAPGTRLGRFEIRRALGHGGFGVVFLAYDARLNREAALKIPRPEVLLSRSLREQFLREAQAVAALDHAGIVPIFEIGEIGPVGFILSAYCQGPTLHAWLRQQTTSVPPAVAAAIVQQLAEAVQHAHARGILHRDIKPSNVLLDPLPESRNSRFPFVPRLSDFGLAKRLDHAGEEQQSRVLLGTPRYMAPEQAAGNEPDIGVHSDVYALGAVLFELLSGQPPFVGQSDQETLRLILAADLPLKPLRQAQVPADLEAICRKCLQVRPADRYASARDLAADLGRFAQGEPVSARPLNAGRRFARACRRRPLISALSLALLVAVLVGVGVGGWQWNRAEQHLVTAQAENRRAEANLQQAENTLLDLAWIVEESALWAPASASFSEVVDATLKQYLDEVTSQGNQPNGAILAAVYSLSGTGTGPRRDRQTRDRNYRLAIDLWRQVVTEHPDNESFRRGLSLCLLKFSQFENEGHRAAGQDPAVFRREFYQQIRDDQRFVGWSLDEYTRLILERADAMAPNSVTVETYETGLTAVEVLLESSPEQASYLLRQGQYLTRIARTKRRLLDRAEVNENVSAARKAFEHVLKLDPDNQTARAELAEAHRFLGMEARGRKQLVEAEDALKTSVALHESLSNPDLKQRLLRADSNRNLANIQLSLDKKHDALGSFGRCRADMSAGLFRQILDSEELRQMAFSCHREGVLAQDLNELQIAKAAFAAGVEAFHHYLHEGESPDHGRPPNIKRALTQAECHFYLARHQTAAGETDSAITNLELAIAILEPVAKRPTADIRVRERYRKAQAALQEVKTKPRQARASSQRHNRGRQNSMHG